MAPKPRTNEGEAPESVERGGEKRPVSALHRAAQGSAAPLPNGIRLEAAHCHEGKRVARGAYGEDRSQAALAAHSQDRHPHPARRAQTPSLTIRSPRLDDS